MPIPKTVITEQEYLEQERIADHKSEFYKGEIFAMAVGSKEHNAIVASLIIETGQFLKGKKCKIFPSDMRVFSPASGLYTYPDVTIVCGKEEYRDDKFDTLLNPTVIMEVLSPATEDYDRGTKFMLYRSISSLQNYILISSTEVTADVYARSDDKWILTTSKTKEESLYINAINFTLPLRDIYAQVDETA